MNWALAQGILGRGRAALLPPSAAVGPNTYLSQHDFLRMVAVAFVLHAAIFTIASLIPQEKVVTIPVRALSFRLGDGDRVSAVGMTMTATPPSAPAPVMKATRDETWQPNARAAAPKVPAPLRPIAKPVAAAPRPQPVPIKAPKFVPAPVPAPAPAPAVRQTPSEQPPPRQVPVENNQPSPQPEPKVEPKPSEPAPAPAPVPAPAEPAAEKAAPSTLPSLAALTQNQPAIAGSPQQYVREAGVPVAELTKVGSRSGEGESPQVIRERYEQQISGWVGKHKTYPADGGGREGRVIVRMRIDRTGYVRYYAIEQSSGVSALDAAAIDMIRRANPMPAVPENYPSGALIEFLIPITFRAPR